MKSNNILKQSLLLVGVSSCFATSAFAAQTTYLDGGSRIKPLAMSFSEELLVLDTNSPAITIPEVKTDVKDGTAAPQISTSNQSTAATSQAEQASQASTATNAPALTASEQKVADALKVKSDDASNKKNLEEVFSAKEKTYSLAKKGTVNATYSADYSYFRDTRLDIALNDNSTTLKRLQIEEDAQHTITNTFDIQYGLLDNLTISASLPVVAKTDLAKKANVTGLGDIGFGLRWEPYPMERKKMPLIISGNVSLRTGVSPYEINPATDLSTGKGYYSVGFGASTRKYVDPIVLFGSASLNYGVPVSGLNNVRGGRIITDLDPGYTAGYAMGFAYSLNYDVSLTMSFQQSFAVGTKYYFSTGEYVRSADQSNASIAISLGVRVSPKTIVNTTVGFGLTPDAPDVSLGLSFPMEFVGLGKVTSK